MSHRSRLLAVSIALFAFVAAPHQSAAQLAGGKWAVEPDNYDLSGSWGMTGVAFVPFGNDFYVGGGWDIRATDRDDGNGVRSSYDRFELSATDVVLETDDDGLHMRVEYEGTFYHRELYVTVDTETDPLKTLYPACAFVDHEYDVQATFEDYFFQWTVDNTFGRYRFQMTGTARTESPYEHVADFVLYPPRNGVSWLDLFQTQDGNAINLDAPIANVLPNMVVNAGQFPSGCDRRADNRGVARFIRGLQPPSDLVPKDNITGVVRDPDTADPIPSSVVTLYRLAAPLRAKGAGESEDAYRAYVVQTVSAAESLRSTTTDAAGAFAFSDVPLWRKTGANSYKMRTLFGIVAVPGTTTDLGGSTVYYLPVGHSNFELGESPHVVLEPPASAELGIKAELARTLSALGPTYLAPAEAPTIAYIESLIGLPTITPAQREGVRRGIWAERTVYQAAVRAKQFSHVTMQNFGKYIASIVTAVFSTKRKEIDDAEKKLTKLQQQGKTPNVGDLAGASPSDLTAKIRTLQNTGVLAEVRIANGLKAGLNLAVFNPIGMAVTTSEQELALTIVKESVFSIIDAAITHETNGAAGSVVDIVLSQLAEPLGNQLFDGVSGSYTDYEDSKLTLTLSRMQGWSTDNPTALATDIAAVVTVITEINKLSGDLEDALTWSEFLGTALDSIQTIASLLAASPHAKLADEIAGLLKHVNASAAFLLPLRAVLITLPALSQQGVDRAFGITAARPGFADGLVPSSTNAGAIISPLYIATTTLNDDHLTPLAAALRADTPGAFLELLTASDGTGYLAALDRWQRLREQAFGLLEFSVRSAGDKQAYAGQLVELFEHGMELDLRIERLHASAIRFIGETADYADTEAAAYLMAREELLDQLDAISFDLSALKFMLARVRSALNADGLTYPAVHVSGIRVASTTTGATSYATPGEIMEVRARVWNLSSSSAANLSAVATVTTASGTVTLHTPASVSIPSLAADDGAADDGADIAEVSWRLSTDDGSAAVLVEIHLEENGTAPTSFVSNSATAIVAPSPALLDEDSDGMPSAWELGVGLDPTVDDADGDLDSDGLANRREHALGTAPHMADSDGDGLSDAEETTAGTDGVLTNPSNPDSDGDGLQDGEDPEPLSAIDAPRPDPGEPQIAVAETVVYLTESQPRAEVAVSNAGGGALVWRAISDASAIVSARPTQPTSAAPGAPLVLTLDPSFFAEPRQPPLEVVVHVQDLSGADRESVAVRVVLAEPPPDGGDAGTGALPDAGPDGGAGSGDGGGGGCGCQASGETTAPWLAVLLLAALRRRRR